MTNKQKLTPRENPHLNNVRTSIRDALFQLRLLSWSADYDVFSESEAATSALKRLKETLGPPV